MIIHQRLYLPSVLTLIALAQIWTLCHGAQNNTAYSEIFRKLDPCMTQSAVSFIYSSSYPPKTLSELRSTCQYQSEGFKCLKELAKSIPGLIKRGVITFVQNRQRYNKKYCTNLNSEASKNYVRDVKCIMDKRLSNFYEADVHFVNSMVEIRRRNYNDSAVELKYICCNFIDYRRRIIESAGVECKGSKATVEEMVMSIVSSDINLICDDEEKLTTKVCPTLESFNVPKQVNLKPGDFGASATVMYLLMTLGEPDPSMK